MSPAKFDKCVREVKKKIKSGKIKKYYKCGKRKKCKSSPYALCSASVRRR